MLEDSLVEQVARLDRVEEQAGRPQARANSTFGDGSVGGSPGNKRSQSMPMTRAAIAAAAQKFDEALPAATKTSALSAAAAPIRNSRARALLPAMPKPVRSSRLR